MKITKSVKAVAYAAVAACMTLLAVWTVSPLHNAVDFVTAYWRSDILLFVTACSVLGIGVYSFVGYTRRRKAHRADSWFFMAVGTVLLVFAVTVICRFGGITAENFNDAAVAALNLNIGAASIVPVPFLVRGWILACTVGFSKRERRAAVMAVAVATAIYLTMTISGQLLFQIASLN